MVVPDFVNIDISTIMQYLMTPSFVVNGVEVIVNSFVFSNNVVYVPFFT